MKKFVGILIISILYSSTAFALQLSCKGVNTPNARFIIDNDRIILSESGGSMAFKKKWVMSSNVYKGVYKTSGSNKSKWEVQIDIRRGEAQVVTTTYYSTSSDDVYVRNYVNCR
tara:strand:+ start:283 stop:624 length:342 start_codon:yes stop_codon:yes gene_type:complete